MSRKRRKSKHQRPGIFKYSVETYLNEQQCNYLISKIVLETMSEEAETSLEEVWDELCWWWINVSHDNFESNFFKGRGKEWIIQRSKTEKEWIIISVSLLQLLYLLSLNIDRYNEKKKFVLRIIKLPVGIISNSNFKSVRCINVLVWF